MSTTTITTETNLEVEANVYFLNRDPKYEEVKPYTLRYTPEDGFPQTNVKRTLHGLQFHNMRLEKNLQYEKCGFKVANLESQMTYEDYNDNEKIETIHQREVEACVREALNASSADVLDYVVRRRHESWPIATGNTYSSQQPASAAHIDHTYDAGCKIIRDTYPDQAERLLEGRWQCVNVWHPLQGPLVDWPLAMCDAETVDFEHDTMSGDVVDRDAVFENTQVHYNPAQKWYYLPNQLPSELLIFKNADSESISGASPGVPHASFDNPLTKESDLRRESIELRVLVRW
ncbi:methyltransferase [Xylogone sp. PMI_703]|nr:methyltransferase [Xylogone sp. PMI_703]